MGNFEIKHLGCYEHEESFAQTPNNLFVFLHIRGLVRFQIPGFRLLRPNPFIAFIHPEELLSFQFDKTRRNWVMQTSTDFIQKHSDNTLIKFKWQGKQFSLPRLITLEDNESHNWNHKFESFSRLMSQPTPLNLCQVQLDTIGSFARLLEYSQKQLDKGPEVQLKNNIEKKENFNKSITRLSQGINLSTDHLRALFREKYGLSPNDYKIRCKMSFCMDMISTSTLSMKEIAYEAGFAHLSHFSAQFKQYYGLSPKQAVTKYRLTMST